MDRINLKVAPGDCFLRAKQVLNRVGFGRSKLYAMIGTGEFPKPIPLSSKTCVWLNSEVEAWMQGRVDAVCGVSH